MNFFLKYPFICSLSQLDVLSKMRDGREDVRSYAVDKPWEKIKIATITGTLQQDHLYMIVSRQRARFSPLEKHPGHFLFDQASRTTPVRINFETRAVDQTAYDGSMVLTKSELTDALVNGKGSKIEDLMAITAASKEPYPTGASFHFNGGFSVSSRLSPDLWKFIEFPFKLLPSVPFEFDYRVEYIGKSINYAEVRLDAHKHVRRIAGMINQDEHEREIFVVFYQVDFEDGDTNGIGNRENELELCAAESILIQHFKPLYNEASINFSLEGQNEFLTDIGLAKRMRESGKYKAGGTTVHLTSPAAIQQKINLATGRYYTIKSPSPLSEVNRIVF